MPFVFTNADHTPLADLPIEITVTDTFMGDESKDKVIFTSTMKTDVNGVLDFSYTFPKENYFDIELHFQDEAGKSQETGFLVQPRDIPKTPSSVRSDILFFLVGGIVAFLISRMSKKTIEHS